jgi:hypothetical protein
MPFSTALPWAGKKPDCQDKSGKIRRAARLTCGFCEFFGPTILLPSSLSLIEG